MKNLAVSYKRDQVAVNNDSWMHHLMEDFEENDYKRGQIIFQEGNISRAVYYVLSGKIKLYKYGSDGKEQIIRIARTGDFIGYKSLFIDEKHSVSASVLDDARVKYIPRDDLIHLFNTDHHVSEHFTRLLCKDVILAERKMVSLAYKPVRGRLAETLLNLEKIYGPANGEPASQINLSREDLANLVGTAKETVIRLLSEFKSEGLVNINGKYLTILDERGLTRIDRLYS